jgi:hypothetical protein
LAAVFSYGWALSADTWEVHVVFLVFHGASFRADFSPHAGGCEEH